MTLPSHQDSLIWKTPAVRDLAWALRSPPLLRFSKGPIRFLDGAWCERMYQRYLPRLNALDKRPTELLAHLRARKDLRLGNYFESLLHFWLMDSENGYYRLIAHSFPIRANKKTLGELDFLVQEIASQQIQHWEVAVKFYLGVEPNGEHRHWVGPGLKDRLDLKVEHLIQRQLTLTKRPAAQVALSELGIGECQPVCLLKGRLFYPLGANTEIWQPQQAHVDHPRGWWLREADFLRKFTDSDINWLTLPKNNWLTPMTVFEAQLLSSVSASEVVSSLSEMNDRAIAVIGLRAGIEVERGFITPANWSGVVA